MKAFLDEVVIRGKDLRDFFTAHGRHGDAIDQAVTLVEPSFVESKAVEEGGVRLWKNDNGVLDHEPVYGCSCQATHARTSIRERCQQLPENLVGSDQRHVFDAPDRPKSARMPGALSKQARH